MGVASQYGFASWRSKTLAVVFGLCGSVSAAETTIVAFGDSLIHGYGLAQGDGFVPQLQAWLTAQGQDVTVLNAGVSGDTTMGGLSRVAWTLSPDVDAMIVTLGGNDFLRGLDPAASKANISGIVETAKSQGVEVLLTGMQAPGNYGPEYKAAFDALYGEVASANDALLAESYFAGLPSEDPAELRALMQADGIHPNRDGVALIVQALGPHVLELIEKAAD
ncbi:arylesterase [Cognatishimia sp.]|uniref:arylesterase n=1 Tax=Cognatishimia sp. TaxID=2211648 RepID=UPI0035175C5B